MTVLVVTPYWPSEEFPSAGIFVKRQVDILREKGITVNVFHIEGKGKIFNYLRAIVLLRRFVRNKHFDLVHAHWGNTALIAIFSFLPMAITYRGSDLMGIYKNGKVSFLGKLIVWISKKMAYFSRCLIFVSAELSSKITIDKPKYIIPSGLDLERIPLIDRKIAKKNLGLPLDKKIIIFPGNPERSVKRYKLFINTLNQLNRSDIYPHVIYGVDHQILLQHLNAADFLLFTSAHEGSPNVVKEALACNLPIVSVNVGDVKEHISNIKGCYMVDEDSPEALGNALLEAFNYNYEGYNSRKLVEYLDEHLLVDKLIDIYKKHY